MKLQPAAMSPGAKARNPDGARPPWARAVKCRHLAALALMPGMLCALGTAPARAELSSYAIVEPDASLTVDGRRLRLYGIYVPSTPQTCRTYVLPVACGPRAVLALDAKIGPEFVLCEERARLPDGSTSALCRLNGEDLSAWMLEQGWAIATPGAPFEYQALEKIARSRQLGVWGVPADRINGVPTPRILR